MLISRDRFGAAMHPFGAPLPVLTNGERTHQDTFASDARMIVQAVDATATAIARPFGAIAFSAAGAVKVAKAEPNAGPLRIAGAGLRGVGSGALVGLTGTVTGLGEALVIDLAGGVCLMSLRTCKIAIKGLSAGMHAVFGGEP